MGECAVCGDPCQYVDPPDQEPGEELCSACSTRQQDQLLREFERRLEEP